MARILLIDDDASGRTALRRALKGQGYEVEAHAAGATAMAVLESGAEFDLVITDLKMPEMDGLEVLQRVRDLDKDLPVILITAFGTIENAVEAMGLGARDYLTKPLSLPEVRAKVEKALEAGRLARENRRLSDENQHLRQKVRAERGLTAIVGVSAAMETLKRRLKQVAPTNSSVLIIGESGTGKELIARALHEESLRPDEGDRPFLPINCAAIPKDILESELFGHERGAFTGATSRKPGKFELASGGTLFLDEIGELPLDMQAKLLRVLEEKAFMRVGGVEMVEVNVRILAATNANLETLVARGEFRTDLYYRLKVVTLEIPPLRSRIDDIPELARFFLAGLAAEYDRQGLRVTEAVMETLIRHPWPGNARELRNLLESVVVLSQGLVIDLGDLPVEYGGRDGALPDETPLSSATAAESGSGTATGSNSGRAGETVAPPVAEEESAAAGHPVPDRSEPAPAETADRPAHGGDGPPPPDFQSGLSMAELEKKHILRTLEEQGQNRTRAAKILGIGRRTLQRKLEEYKEDGEDVPPAASE
jgi:DNA-binding NtrC family response regulator